MRNDVFCNLKIALKGINCVINKYFNNELLNCYIFWKNHEMLLEKICHWKTEMFSVKLNWFL